MPSSHLVDRTDEPTLPGVSPYDEQARDLVFKACVEMAAALRDGRFACAEVQAESASR